MRLEERKLGREIEDRGVGESGSCIFAGEVGEIRTSNYADYEQAGQVQGVRFIDASNG